jgi:hypothetical protein
MLKSNGKLVPLLLATSLVACQPSGSSSVEPPPDPPQGELAALYDLKAVSRPEFPVLSAPSQDGEFVFQVHGTEIVVLSTARVKACADGGTCDLDTLNTDDFGSSLSRTDLDVSILDIEERDGFLYVAGGDYGFLILQPNQNDGYHNGYTEIFRATSTPGTASTSRWCMDVDAQGGAILAVFGAMDDSELRVYSPTVPTVLLATYALTPAQGVSHGAQAMAVERDGSMAYLAMGNAGIWRVDRSKDPALPAAQWLAEGPLNPAAGCSTNSIPPYHFVHDIAVVNVDGATRYLYAGADGWGLVEIDLALDWSDDMPFWSGNPTCYWANLPPSNCSEGQSSYIFAQRVTAVYDPAHQEIVVAASFPHSGTDNLTTPYTSFGSLSWDFGHVNPVDFSQNACADEYRVFTRPAGAPAATPTESVSARYAPKVFFATPLNLLASADGTEFWLLDAALQAVHMERQPTQLALTGSADCGVFAYMSAPITPQASLVHPNVMISGVDGAKTCDEQNTLFRLDPGAGKPEFVPFHSLPGDGTRFFLGAFGTAQWIDTTDASKEFLLRGKGFQLAGCSSMPPFQCPGDEGPSLFRIDASSESSLQGLKRIRTLWAPDPAAPPSGSGITWTYSAGRGYSLTAVDDRPGSRLVVETRGGIVHGAWLFDRDELQIRANAAPDGGLIVAAQVPLLTHGTDEVAENQYGNFGVYVDQITKCKTMEPRFFDVADSSGADLRVLGIASGHSVADPQAAGTTFGRPQVTLFDVSEVLGLPAQPPTPVVLRSKTSILEAAAVCLDAQTVMLKDPKQPWIKRPHTLVFVGGSEGFLSVFDVSALFSAQTYTEVSADLEPNVFDQHGDVIFQVDFQPDVTGESLGHLHVGALRRGMIRLAVHDAGNGSVSLTKAGAVNTPGSFGGFQILTVNGKERMIVADHTFYGLRAYGDY